MVNFTILCHSRPELLKQVFRTIGDTSDMSITVLADEPTPEVHEVASSYMENREGAYIVRAKSAGTGAARNMVIAAASAYGRGDYLYLSDDDVAFARPDWLRILVESYEVAYSHGFKVLGAYNHPFHLPGEAIKVSPDRGVYEVQALALQSMLMTWEVWERYGPFNETPAGAVCQGEDVDFGNKIKADGGRLGVVFPPLLTNCGVTNSFGQPIPGADVVRREANAGVIVE